MPPLSRRAFLAGLGLGGLGGVACRQTPRAGVDRPLVIVFGPQHAPRDAQALRARWTGTSGLQLEVLAARTPAEAIDHIQSRRADAGLLSLFDYLYCAEVFGVEPIAQVMRAGDRVVQSGELVVQASSAVQTLEALRGKRLGYVDAYSITGFLLPAALLRDRGIAVEPVWLGSHEAVLQAVRTGAVAAGATYTGHAATQGELRVLGATGAIANEPVFVQNTLQDAARESLRKALEATQPAELAGVADATGFRRPVEHAYVDALATVKAAGQRAEDLFPGGWPRANEHRRPLWSYGP